MQSMDYNYDHSNLTREQLLDKKSNLLNVLDDINNCLDQLDKIDDINSSSNKRIKLNHSNNDNGITPISVSTLVEVNNGIFKPFSNLLIIKILKLAIEGMYGDDEEEEEHNEEKEENDDNVDIDQKILGERFGYYSNIKLVCKDWNAHVIPRLDINNYLFINEHDAIYNYLKVVDTIKHLMNRRRRTGYHISNNETINKLVSELQGNSDDSDSEPKEISIAFSGDAYRDIEEPAYENINVSSKYKYLKYNDKHSESTPYTDSSICTIKSIANEVNRVMKKRNVNSGVFLNNLYRSNEKESNLVGFDSLIYNVFKSYFGEKRIQICNFIITTSKWDKQEDCGVPIVGDCNLKITKVSSKTMNHSFDKTKNAHTLLFNTTNFGWLVGIFNTFIGTGFNGPEPNFENVGCLSAIIVDL